MIIPLNSYSLLLAQIICHIGTAFYLLHYATIQNLILVFCVYFLTGCIGMSITYHRLLTHNSFRCPKWFEIFGTVCGTLGLTGSSISWTAAHRKHHSRADKEGDPHSPKILGYFYAQWLSMFSDVQIYKSPVIRSKFHRLVHNYYFLINICYGILLYVIGGVYAVLTFWLVPACVLWNAGSLINTVCHTKWLGYKTHKLPDNSVNNPILGLLMWGEGWHNNHHRFQSRANIGEKWYEIDIGYQIIKMVKK
jgi:stearoyl-CoA desaturase (delta-9 desaturase)